jgi:sulfide dehydrogenase cytochrome subunit
MLRPAALALAASMTVAAGPSLAQTAPRPAPLVAQSCAGCHGQAGAGRGSAPAIAGLEPARFVQVWGEFRRDERPATIMNRIARGFTDAEVSVLADYFASTR